MKHLANTIMCVLKFTLHRLRTENLGKGPLFCERPQLRFKAGMGAFSSLASDLSAATKVVALANNGERMTSQEVWPY